MRFAFEESNDLMDCLVIPIIHVLKHFQSFILGLLSRSLLVHTHFDGQKFEKNLTTFAKTTVIPISVTHF